MDGGSGETTVDAAGAGFDAATSAAAAGREGAHSLDVEGADATHQRRFHLSAVEKGQSESRFGKEEELVIEGTNQRE